MGCHLKQGEQEGFTKKGQLSKDLKEVGEALRNSWEEHQVQGPESEEDSW